MICLAAFLLFKTIHISVQSIIYLTTVRLHSTRLVMLSCCPIAGMNKRYMYNTHLTAIKHIIVFIQCLWLCRRIKLVFTAQKSSGCFPAGTGINGGKHFQKKSRALSKCPRKYLSHYYS